MAFRVGGLRPQLSSYLMAFRVGGLRPPVVVVFDGF